MKVFRFLVVALVSFALNAPLARAQSHDLPSLGEAGGEELPPAIERRLGEQIMLQVRRDPTYLPDPESTEYLNNLGYRLVAVSPSRSLDFVFFVIRDPMLNAFALPGGFIGVHTGLVITSQSESELASVLGHEIGHVTQRHIARMIARQKESTAMAIGALLLAILAARAGGSSSGDLTQAAILGSQAAMMQQQLNFSREAEREADRVGFQTLVEAGFDGRGMEGFFARMQAGTRIYEGTAPAYLRTHPMTVERISDMQNRTRSLPFKQRADSLEFQLVRARLRVLQETTLAGLARRAGVLQRPDLEPDDPRRVRRALWRRGRGAEAQHAGGRTAERAGRQAPRAGQLGRCWTSSWSEARFAAARDDDERATRRSSSRRRTPRGIRCPASAAHHYVDLLLKTEPVPGRDRLPPQPAGDHAHQPAYYALLGRAYEALNRKSLHHQAVARCMRMFGAVAPAIQQLETGTARERRRLLHDVRDRRPPARPARRVQARTGDC